MGEGVGDQVGTADGFLLGRLVVGVVDGAPVVGLNEGLLVVGF